MWREGEPNRDRDWMWNHVDYEYDQLNIDREEEGHPGCAGMYGGRLFASRCSLEMPCFCESGAATAKSEYFQLANEVRAKFFLGVAAKNLDPDLGGGEVRGAEIDRTLVLVRLREGE